MAAKEAAVEQALSANSAADDNTVKLLIFLLQPFEPLLLLRLELKLIRFVQE